MLAEERKKSARSEDMWQSTPRKAEAGGAPQCPSIRRPLPGHDTFRLKCTFPSQGHGSVPEFQSRSPDTACTSRAGRLKTVEIALHPCHFINTVAGPQVGHEALLP